MTSLHVLGDTACVAMQAPLQAYARVARKTQQQGALSTQPLLKQTERAMPQVRTRKQHQAKRLLQGLQQTLTNPLSKGHV